MAGHSKWANIQHRKGRQDAKRGKVWTKIIREITVAAKAGGADPETNPRLRLAWDKANNVNMPKENIQRAIQRGAGGADNDSYEELRYEGYGVAGAAVVVEAMTDNRTRTAADVRHAFTKHGGNLGQDGSVAFLFRHCGQFIFPPGSNEEHIMEVALEAGADDIITEDDGSIEVLTDVPFYMAVKLAFAAAGITPAEDDLIMKPLTENVLSGEDAVKMQKLLDALEALDDVQEVYTNVILEEGTE